MPTSTVAAPARSAPARSAQVSVTRPSRMVDGRRTAVVLLPTKVVNECAPTRETVQGALLFFPVVYPAESSDRGLLEVALEAAAAGAAVLRELFRSSSLRVRAKGPNDLVSSADHAAEAAIARVIRGHFPDAAFLGEESGRSGGRGDDLEWIVDPLDGTNNFLQGLPIFCTSVACCRRGEPVAGVVQEPLTGTVYSAVRGGGAWCRPGTPGAAAERLQVERAAGDRRRLPRHRLSVPRPRRPRPLPGRLPRGLPAGARDAPLRRRGARPRPHRGRASTTASSSSAFRPGTSPPACCSSRRRAAG